jgi:hypothetical protein
MKTEVLKEGYREFFRENGYVVVKNAVPKEMCDRLIQRIYDFMGKSEADSEGWYTPAAGMDDYFPDQGGGFLPLYQDQTLWDIRMLPKIYDVFAEIIGDEKLWVSLDRVNMKPPRRESHLNLSASHIHWDTDTAKLTFPHPIPSGRLQGVVYLADTAANQGGFECVPSIFQNLESFIKSQPKDRNPRIPNIEGHEVVPIPGEAGDMVIWDVLLPHGNGQNRSGNLRFAQYVTMFPAAPDNTEQLNARIDAWRNYKSVTPIFPEDPRQWERSHNEGPANLSELGRKLLGLDSW